MGDVWISMPYDSFGDQICFLGAARIYAKRHPEHRVHVNILPDIVNSYDNHLLTFGRRGEQIECVPCWDRHRVKERSPDKTYVGCYLAAMGEPVIENPAFEGPILDPEPSLPRSKYIVLQPYSVYARNPQDRHLYVQELVDQCREHFPDVKIICVGATNTARVISGVDYNFLSDEKIELLRLIQHAALVLTPRSVSAHVAAGYKVPAFVWVSGDGEDWHLDYPNWHHARCSVDHSPIIAAAILFGFLEEIGMGDVDRVLTSSTYQVNLQAQMHDRIVLEACENFHLHWRNLRIEMGLTDCAKMLDLFWYGSSELLKLVNGKIVSLPLEAICPYNNSHKLLPDGDFENVDQADTAEHHAGVEWMVKTMRSGNCPMTYPIAVRPAWIGKERFPRPQDRKTGNIFQRLDGFKRYMAHKQLGLKTIDCFIMSEDAPGCQHQHAAFMTENDKNIPRITLGSEFFAEIGKDTLTFLETEKQHFKRNVVERLKNGMIHVHVGDARMEFSKSEFKMFSEMIGEAARNS